MIPTLTQIQNTATYLVLIIGLAGVLYLIFKAMDWACDAVETRLVARDARARENVVSLADRRRQIQALVVSGQRQERR